MIKLKKSLFLVILSLLLVVSAINIGWGVSRKLQTGKKTTEETVGLLSDDFCEQITNLEDLIQREITGVIYFGRDSCENCLQLNYILKQIITDNEYCVYKFDTDTWRESEAYEKVLEMYHVQSVPILVEVDENGKILSAFEIDGLKYGEIENGLMDFFSNLTVSVKGKSSA